MTWKLQIHAQHSNHEPDYSSVKQSSLYITHGLYECAPHWQHIVLCRTHGLTMRWHGQVWWSTFRCTQSQSSSALFSWD